MAGSNGLPIGFGRSNRVTLCKRGWNLNISQMRNITASHFGWRKSVLLGSVYACSLAALMAIGSASAEAKARHEPAPKPAVQASKGPFGDIPKGPVEIFVSIDQQKLHLYSDGAHIADTSVATGVPSLPTPLGVFSVIQKQIFHRSNIYSGAPMPFMQRITWSGIALHEGESIGHRASHGCIRMPADFARKLYQFTRIGARVIVANEELKPTVFADPHLFVHKVPTPPAAPAMAAAPAKTAPSGDEAKPAEAAVTPIADSSAAAQSNDAATPAASEAVKAVPSGNGGTKSSETAPTAKPEGSMVDQSPAAAQSNQPATESDPGRPAQTGVPASELGTIPVTQMPSPLTAQAPVLPVVQQQPSPLVKDTVVIQIPHDRLRGTDASPTLLVDASNGTVPLPASKPADANAAPADKKIPIAIFISRKTQRIYVRQNFEPLFDAAITIDHPEQLIGTHVFTAMAYLDDGSTFRWDVISMPGVQPKAKRVQAKEIVTYDRYGRPRRHEVAEKPVSDLPPPQTPAEALARIQIPQDIIDRISAMILPGSSLIVSDQGLGEETGEGTDFVVVTSKS